MLRSWSHKQQQCHILMESKEIFLQPLSYVRTPICDVAEVISGWLEQELHIRGPYLNCE